MYWGVEMGVRMLACWNCCSCQRSLNLQIRSVCATYLHRETASPTREFIFSVSRVRERNRGAGGWVSCWRSCKPLVMESGGSTSLASRPLPIPLIPCSPEKVGTCFLAWCGTAFWHGQACLTKSHAVLPGPRRATCTDIAARIHRAEFCFQ